MNNPTKKLLELVDDGKSYEEICIVAQQLGLQGDKLRTALQEVNYQLLQRDAQLSEQSHALEWVAVGLIITAIATLMLIFYPEVERLSRFYYMAITGIFGGLNIVLIGWKHWKDNQKIKEDEELS